MLDWIGDNRAWLFDGLGVLVIGGIAAFFAARWRERRRRLPTGPPSAGRGGNALVIGGSGAARGGHGGSATPGAVSGGDGGHARVIGGQGTAIGGDGGRGGPYGPGGPGGSAEMLSSSGTVRGGDGGDTARPGRPALGGASPLEKLDELWIKSLPGMTDRYGLHKPGRGGDSYQAYVSWEERRYDMNVLLHLLERDHPGLLDAVDLEVAELSTVSEQDWWTHAVGLFPTETNRAMKHARDTEDA